MTLYHPGILASKLEQLALELLRWSYRATSTREAAVSLQHQVETQLELTHAQSAVLTTQLQQDHTEIARVDVALMILAETCNAAKAQAETTATQVQQALDEAQATRTHWETALTEARARFAQAEQALAKAQREIQQAQAEVAAAQAALERLAGTANEKEATAHLHDTQTWMQRAEREQGHAERELEQAQACITACTQAIATATQAVQVAVSTREQAKWAMYAAERGIEYVLAAGKALAMGKVSLHTEEEAVKATIEIIDKATVATDQAAEHCRVGSDHEREAQQYDTQAHNFLNERIASLIALNRSELELVSTEWVSTLLPSSPLQPSEALTSPEPVAYLRGIQVESGKQPDTSEQMEVERGPGRRSREVLPDGRQVIVSGNPKRYAKFNHFQGKNDYGYMGTCGLVSCQDVLLQFGKRVSENDVVGHAIRYKLCQTGGDPYDQGATTIIQQAQILRDFGVPAHQEIRGNVADLVTKFEQGRGIIIGVNAGILWGDKNHLGTGGPNHAVVVTGVVRDATSGALLGFYINDSGNKDEHGNARSGQFVSIETMRKAWEKIRGTSVVTDKTHRW